MAGVTAAWELSRPGWRDRFDAITVYQRGWLLGGKGASTRGAHGEILEHGLHVWPGYYDNAFRLLRDCYAELDRARTDPSCPIRTWRDAFVPAPDVGVFEHVDGRVETVVGPVPHQRARAGRDRRTRRRRSLTSYDAASRSRRPRSAPAAGADRPASAPSSTSSPR